METLETVTFPDCKDDMVDEDAWHAWLMRFLLSQAIGLLSCRDE